MKTRAQHCTLVSQIAFSKWQHKPLRSCHIIGRTVVTKTKKWWSSTMQTRDCRRHEKRNVTEQDEVNDKGSPSNGHSWQNRNKTHTKTTNYWFQGKNYITCRISKSTYVPAIWSRYMKISMKVNTKNIHHLSRVACMYHLNILLVQRKINKDNLRNIYFTINDHRRKSIQ